ncbi:MAG: hypothetical protein RBS56_04960 [Candidatus Gracilibacteria bacterium]|jgi:hypothetical protein|nr:hypothetical protein [Candidatus Gracilibacteria bacterium]
MKTKLVGLKEYRLNLTALTKEMACNKYRIIVLNKNKPIFEVSPISENLFEMEKLKKEVSKARKEYKKGNFVSEEEVLKSSTDEL